MPVNDYSPVWFDTFLRTYWPHQTEKELDFLARHLPLPSYRMLFDVCCGPGRHALPLAARGYAVTGVDRDAAMIAEAQHAARDLPAGAGGATFIQADMRDLAAVPGMFDGALCLWQSFGYFDAGTNAAVLLGMRDSLNPRGRLVLDLYHREYFATHQGVEVAERAGRRITTTRTMAGDRLTVQIAYDDAPPDVVEWQLYTPDAITALADGLGLTTILACSDFDDTRPPTPNSPRMQLVFARR
jgi:SAM-dependent methyltransferase